MELIERPNLKAAHYLNSILFDTFRDECIRDANISGLTVPSDVDITTWFNTLKSYCASAIKTKGITKRIYSYSLKTKINSGRLFSGGSIQSIWSVYRGLLCDGIMTDIDMVNAHPTILSYICKKHHIHTPYLDMYNANREMFWRDFKTKAAGKQMYLIATNSDTSVKMKSKPEHFKSYETEMKKIQFELVSKPEYAEIINSVPDDKKNNFNGSAINRILCHYENIILQHIIHYINTQNIEIAVLMFDGLMIYGNHYDNTDLLTNIQNYINEQIPTLNMKLSYKQHNTSIRIPDDFDENNYSVTGSSRVATDDNAAAQIIYDELKPILIADKTGRMFLKRKHIWTCETRDIEDFVMQFILNSNICKKNDKDKYSSFSQNYNSAKNIYNVLLGKIRIENSKDIYNKFHTSTQGKICFNDGVLDFDNGCFTKWDDVNFELYSPLCIDYDYADYHANPDYDIVNEVKSKIFEPMFGDKLDIALQFFARAISGHCEDKNWATYLGNRDCGKGVVYEAFKCTFQDYVQTFELNNLMCVRDTNVEEVSRKLYWLIPLEFTRLAISQETPPEKSGSKLRVGLFKKLAGGKDTIVARRNYDRQDTHFNIDTTFMMFGNDDIILDLKDGNEHRIQFSSCYQFKSQQEIDCILQDMRNSGADDATVQLIASKYKVGDPSIKSKCDTLAWKLAIIRLIYDNRSNKAVQIDFSNTEIDGDEKTSLRKNILLTYVISNEKQPPISLDQLCEEFDCGKKSLAAELKAMGLQITKCNSGELRNKMVIANLKKIASPSPELSPEL